MSFGVLASISASVAVLLFEASIAPVYDWIKVVLCMAVIGAGATGLDLFGRRQAERFPDSRYRPDRLPTQKGRFRTSLIATTVIVWIGVTTATVRPHGQNALPHFAAAAFLFLVVPQLVARSVLRHEQSQTGC